MSELINIEMWIWPNRVQRNKNERKERKKNKIKYEPCIPKSQQPRQTESIYIYIYIIESAAHFGFVKIRITIIVKVTVRNAISCGWRASAQQALME